MRFQYALFLSLFLAAGCLSDEEETPVVLSEETKAFNACLDGVEAGEKPLIVARECEALCKAKKPNRVACGAMALAYVQDIGKEVGKYASLLKPSQSPADFALQTASSELEAARRLQPNIDVGQFIEPYIAAIVDDLRGIREGVHGYLNAPTGATGQAPDIEIEKLPLDTGLVAFIYDRPDSFALKGYWRESDMAALGAAANLGLAVVDFLYAHNLNVNIPPSAEFSGGLAVLLSTAVQILDDSREFLLLQDPVTHELSRDQLHAFFALLAGRAIGDDVVPAYAGLLAALERDFAAESVREGNLFQVSDIDGDGTLSRGDAMKLTLLVNDKDVDLAFPYPLSATLTQEIFAFLKGHADNFDGGPAVHVAPLVNSAFREFAILAFAGTKSMPDAVAIDLLDFYTDFDGVRRLLPFWYYDGGGSGSNPDYFDNASNYTTGGYYIAYEGEGWIDEAHFQWTGDITLDWLEFGDAPGGFAADGVSTETAATELPYVLWQDPAFAGLLKLNLTPLIDYGVLSTLAVDEFADPDNRQVNAGLNALILWAQE